MLVDASAIVAILTREPEADALADVLENSRAAITSPIAIFEAVLGICRIPFATDPQYCLKNRDRRISRGGGSPDGPDYRQGGAYGACGFLPLRQGARASRATQPWRLLCVCNGKERSNSTAVQRRRFRQDRYTRRRAVALIIPKMPPKAMRKTRCGKRRRSGQPLSHRRPREGGGPGRAVEPWRPRFPLSRE